MKKLDVINTQFQRLYELLATGLISHETYRDQVTQLNKVLASTTEDAIQTARDGEQVYEGGLEQSTGKAETVV